MCFGHDHPVQRQGDGGVLVAFAPVSTHSRRELALDTYATMGGVPVPSDSGF